MVIFEAKESFIFHLVVASALKYYSECLFYSDSCSFSNLVSIADFSLAEISGFNILFLNCEKFSFCCFSVGYSPLH